MGRLRQLRQDDGIVIDWLVKLVIFLLIAGFVVFEAAAVLLVRATTADTASEAAVEAGFVYRNTRDEERAQNEAEAYMNSEGVELVAFRVDEEADELVVTGRKKAKTLLIHNFDFFEDMVTAEMTESAPLPGN